MFIAFGNTLINTDHIVSVGGLINEHNYSTRKHYFEVTMVNNKNIESNRYTDFDKAKEEYRKLIKSLITRGDNEQKK